MCLVMAINFGGALYPWNSGQIIALFVLAFVLLIAFGIQQRFAWLTTTAERMFPVHLLNNLEANLLFVAAAGCNAAGFIPIYYIPVYFQFTRGDTALDAAVRLLPLIILLSATIMANGYLMGKLGYYQPWYLIGGALALAGNVLLCESRKVEDQSSVANKIKQLELTLPPAPLKSTATKSSLLSDQVRSFKPATRPFRL